MRKSEHGIAGYNPGKQVVPSLDRVGGLWISKRDKGKRDYILDIEKRADSMMEPTKYSPVDHDGFDKKVTRFFASKSPRKTEIEML